MSNVLGNCQECGETKPCSCGFGGFNADDDADPTAVEVVAFLNGEAPLEGLWFGDPYAATHRGSLFWWRKYLPVLTRPPAADAGEVREAAQALVGKLDATVSCASGKCGVPNFGDEFHALKDALAILPTGADIARVAPTFREGVEAAAKVAENRAAIWKTKDGPCAESLEDECLDLAAAIRAIGGE